MAALSVATMLMTGCGSTMSDHDADFPARNSAVEASRKLTSWPSLEDTEQALRGLVFKVAGVATQINPSMRWEWVHDPERAGCSGPFRDSDGSRAYLPDYVAPRTPISDKDWPRVMQVAREASREVGATTVQTFQDAPGNHDVWFINDEDGTTIKVSTKGNAVITAITGCRLPKDKRSAG